MQDDGAIEVGRAGSTVVVNVRGRGTLGNSHPLETCLTSALDAAAEDVVMDLAECTHLDSTFMGVMAGMSQRLQDAGKGALRVANPSDSTLGTMRRVGLMRVVDLTDGAAPAPEVAAMELAPTDLSKLDRGRHMLDAHRELSAMSDANAAEFGQLIHTLEANVAKHQADPDQT